MALSSFAFVVLLLCSCALFFFYLFSIQSIKTKFIIFTCAFRFLFECNMWCTVTVLAHTRSGVTFPVINARQTHATIIWFEYVVCLWLHCCFRMIVLSFAKWHVDVSFYRSRVRAFNACNTHFHVVMANCVTIWLIVCHMMHFCCCCNFDTL